VSEDPREDEAMENQIGTGQKKWGENPHVDVFGLMLERGSSWTRAVTKLSLLMRASLRFSWRIQPSLQSFVASTLCIEVSYKKESSLSR
jgi:hypothetical protein